MFPGTDQPWLKIALCTALAFAWMPPARAASLSGSGATICDSLASVSAERQAAERAKMSADLGLLVEAAQAFHAALDDVSDRGLAPGQADRLQELWAQHVDRLAPLLPDVPGAAAPREQLSGWVLQLEQGVDLGQPMAPGQHVQALRLALLETALGLKPVGRAEVGQYLRRLRNIGDFLAESNRPGGADRARWLVTASFYLDGHFDDVRQRLADALDDAGRYGAARCAERRPANAGGDEP